MTELARRIASDDPASTFFRHNVGVSRFPTYGTDPLPPRDGTDMLLVEFQRCSAAMMNAAAGTFAVPAGLAQTLMLDASRNWGFPVGTATYMVPAPLTLPVGELCRNNSFNFAGERWDAARAAADCDALLRLFWGWLGAASGMLPSTSGGEVAETARPLIATIEGYFSDSPDSHEMRAANPPGAAPSGSSLILAAIDRAYENAEFDEAATAIAVCARDEAKRFIVSDRLHTVPSIEFSDDGSLSLGWRHAGKGVLLIFVGDGCPGYSIREPNGLYPATGSEFALADGLPAPVRAAIDEVTQGAAAARLK
jgi:hypothetical protein